MTDKQERLAEDWFRRVRNSQFSHHASGLYFTKLNYFLGVPTVVLSTIVGTAVFVSLDNQAIGNYKIAIGIISMIASILAALHTFLDFSLRAEKHKSNAAGYASVRRDLEILLTSPVEDSREVSNRLEKIKIHIDNLASSAEEIPENIWKKVDEDINSRDHDRIVFIPKKEKYSKEDSVENKSDN